MKYQSCATVPEDVDASERPDTFGTHTWWLLTRQTVGAEKLVVNTGVLPGSTAHQLHRHPHAEQAIIVLKGSGLHLRVGSEPVEVHEGDFVYIPRNEWHGFANHTAEDVHIASIYGGVGDKTEAGYELFSGPPHDFDAPLPPRTKAGE